MDDEFRRIRFESADDDCGFYKMHRLSNGQTIGLYLFEERYYKKTEYWVFLVIANKRRHIQDFLNQKKDIISNRETGRCGAEGIVWARSQLLLFEEECCRDGDMICILWSDNRRRNAYEHGLKKYGYIIGNRFGKKCLYKKIVRCEDD